MMKIKIFIIIFSFAVINGVCDAQTTKVAILDFENVSGAAEYESWGKALSNMLITDLANNIHPKKVEFFERSQLNKLLDEQNLQKSKNFDEKTAVDFGKLSGVNYVFVGSVFVMGKTCNFSSKLVDVQTSKILLAKDVSGNVEEFLKLKTELAEAIANQFNYPILLEPAYKEPSTAPTTINQYLKILTTMDGGDMEKAEEMRRLFEETNPEFRYFADVKEDIEELKKQVAQNTEDIEVLNKSGGRVVNAATPRELVINYANPLSTVDDHKKIIMELLKFDLDQVSEGYFNEISNIDVPYVRGFGWGDVKNWHNALNFLDTILSVDRKFNRVEKELNPETLAFYVFFHIYSYASYMSVCEDGEIKYKYGYNMEGCTNKAIVILQKLYSYMELNEINFTFDKSLFEDYTLKKTSYIFCPNEIKEKRNIGRCYYSCENENLTLDALLNFLSSEYKYVRI